MDMVTWVRPITSRTLPNTYFDNEFLQSNYVESNAHNLKYC